jgi:hypothetical protein
MTVPKLASFKDINQGRPIESSALHLLSIGFFTTWSGASMNNKKRGMYA